MNDHSKKLYGHLVSVNEARIAHNILFATFVLSVPLYEEWKNLS